MKKVKNTKKGFDEVIDKRTKLKLENVEARKMISIVESEIKITDKTVERIENCGTFVKFLADMNLEHLKLDKSNFCKHRFCPHCAYNKARKDTHLLMVCMKYIKEKEKREFVLLTLTVPNCKGTDLSDTIFEMNKGLFRLFHYKSVSQMCLGYVKKLEVTYNKDANTYHPHFHILMAVRKSYFTSRDYIKQSQWLDLWRKAMRDDSITQVDVRRFKENEEHKGVLEMSKYLGKSSDYLHSPEVFKTYYESLKGKQLINYSGIFDIAKKLYESNQLTNFEETDSIEYVYKIFASWQKDMYNTKVVELNSEEKEMYNRNNKIDSSIEEFND